METQNEVMSAIDAPLELRPEILDAIRVNAPAHEFFGVIDCLMRIFGFQALAERASGVGEQV